MKREVLIKLNSYNKEIRQLTALKSLKVVLLINKRLRKEKEELQNKIDEILCTPNLRGMSRKIQSQKKEINKLYSELQSLRLQVSDQSQFKGTGKIADIVDEALNKEG